MDDVIYIADSAALIAMHKQLQGCCWLAVDTEFIREKTYFPQLALVQIATAESIYCVDPLAIDDLSPLFELFEKPDIIKVFHAASQDLEIFYHQRNSVPQSLFDTQIAAALLGMGEQISYALLVKKLLNLDLDKSHSRTDWMRRPLHTEQIRYAADDVRYLSRIYPLLTDKLEQLDRMSWLSKEMTRLQDPATYEPDPLNCWQRVKGSGKLKSKQLNILKHLAAWRERQAIQSNRPRRWILSDDVLLNLSIQRPVNREQLQNIRSLDSKIIERHAGELLDLIAAAQKEPQETWPAVYHSKKPTAQEEATIDLLMAVVHLRAAEHQLGPGQITSRSELLKLIRGEQNLAVLNGWRRQIAGQAILDTFQGKLRLVCEQGHTTLQCK